MGVLRSIHSFIFPTSLSFMPIFRILALSALDLISVTKVAIVLECEFLPTFQNRVYNIIEYSEWCV